LAQPPEACASRLTVMDATDELVTSDNLGTGLVHRPTENDSAVGSFNFKNHRRAQDKAGRGKRSRPDRPGKRATIATGISHRPADAKATVRVRITLSHHSLSHPPLPRTVIVKPPRWTQELDDPVAIKSRYPEAGEVSLVAIGTATLYAIRPGEGVVGGAASDANDLSSERGGGQRDAVVSRQSARPGDGGQGIETIRAIDMQCAG